MSKTKRKSKTWIWVLCLILAVLITGAGVYAGTNWKTVKGWFKNDKGAEADIVETTNTIPSEQAFVIE